MPFIAQGKTNWKFLLIVIIIAIIVGGVMIFVTELTKYPCWWSSSQEITKTEEDETADWQTYRNEEYGFEFKYPEVFDRFDSCKLVEEENTIRIGSRFLILISGSKGLSLSEYVMKEKEESLHEQVFPPPEEAWHQEDIYITDIKGIKAVWFHGSRYSQMIYLLKDNKMIDICFTAGISCLDYYAEQGLLDEVHELYIFEQIPNTFKFLE